MLGTDDRALLVDLLSPPEDGFRLEQAVGTTFTLNLEALLRVPLGVVGAEWREHADPLGVMHAVQSTVDRLNVFCQAGMVSVPPSAGILGFLEPMVHQVARPQPGRLFHPKVWLLSFINDEGERQMRLLCGSRNLTNDRTWDAVVRLDGGLGTRQRAVNRPLSEFVEALPGRATMALPAPRAASISELADAVRFVDWTAPEGAIDGDWLQFHVFGRGRRTRPDMSGRRRLVISPFISAEGLDVVWPDHSEGTVISRAESLAALEPSYRQELADEFDARLFTIDDAAAVPQIDEDEAGRRWELAGLHAKVYVVERGNRVHLFIGSANATGNGWDGNDEVMVEIVGRPKAMGIDRTLAEGAGSIASVLVPFVDGQAEPAADDPLRRQLERVLIELAEQPFSAIATEAPDGTWAESVLSTTAVPVLPDTARLYTRLLSTRDERVAEAGAPLSEQWAGLAPEDLTPFVALRLSVGPPSAQVEVTTVVLATLHGAPEDRLDRLLARHVGSPEAFLRFLLLLLQGEDQGSLAAALSGDSSATQFGPFGTGSAGIMESLVLALADRPDVLDDIGRLVDRLNATDAGRDVLPTGWDELWSQISRARILLEES